MDFLQNLSFFMTGAATFFFFLVAVHIYPNKNRSSFSRMLFWMISGTSFVFFKDCVYIFIDFDNLDRDYFYRLLLCIDQTIVPLIGTLLLETVYPGSSRSLWTKIALTIPLVLILLNAIFPCDFAFYSTLAVTFIYGALAIYRILKGSYKYEKYIVNNFSNVEMLSVMWVRKSMLMLFFLLLLWCGLAFVDPYLNMTIFYFSTIVVAIHVFYHAQRYFDLKVSGKAKLAKGKMEKEEQEISDYMMSNKSNEMADTIAEALEESISPQEQKMDETFRNRLNDLVNKKKVWMNPTISLTELASSIGTNRTYLSNYLNMELDTTFSDYINSFRINEACRLLEKGDSRSYEEIFVHCGFNSLSTFKRSFIKVMNMTPAAYAASKTKTKN